MGGAAFAYFKFIKGKANHKNSSNPDDYDYEDGEELPDEEDIELEDEESDELDADRGGGEESEDETPCPGIPPQAGGREGHFPSSLFTQKPPLLWLWELWAALRGSLPS